MRLLGTYQRHVVGETLRAFFLAWLAITAVIVIFMVMAEATRAGLAPGEVLRLTPLIMPSSVPFTVPVALLFAITVVYGRIAADNEVMALKAAGLSPWIVIWPALALALFTSIGLGWLSNDAIPRANHRAKLILFNNVEEMLYKVLKKERMFNNPGWPFVIIVKDVEGKTLIDPVFKHRAKLDEKAQAEADAASILPGAKPAPAPEPGYDLIVSARRAQLKFDLARAVAEVYLSDATIQRLGPEADVSLVNDKVLELPLPQDKTRMTAPPQRVQEMTLGELKVRRAELDELIRNERLRQALGMSMWIGSGRLNRVDWPHVHTAYIDDQRWRRLAMQIETEMHFRVALSAGAFFFVLLGAPIGILFAKRDFLSAFITCFLPVILVYYPLLLAGVNLGKEGILDPSYALWMGNAALGLLASFSVLPRVLKH